MQNNENSSEDKALYVIIAIIVVIVLCVKYCGTSKDDNTDKYKNSSDITSNTAFSECISLKKTRKSKLGEDYDYLVKNTDDCINKLHDISIQLAKSINSSYYTIDYYSDERVYNKSYEHYDDDESYQIHRKWLKSDEHKKHYVASYSDGHFSKYPAKDW